MLSNPPDEIGSEELARALYAAHGPAIEHWARLRFSDAQVAQEIVQEVVLNAWRRYHQFDSARGGERAWMFGIARNVAASNHRANRRHLWSVATSDPPEGEFADIDTSRLVDRSLIVDAMRTLSVDQRAVVEAAYWKRLSTREIASEFGIPDGTVKSRLHYAMRNLRAALEEREVL